MNFIEERLDDHNKLINDWRSRKPNVNTRHILSYRFIFKSEFIATLFRKVNFDSMINAYSQAQVNHKLKRESSNLYRLQKHVQDYLESTSNPDSNAFRKYLSLSVGRNSMLHDAFNQLYGREKRELMLPLKVKIGSGEGEEGQDQGGITHEFFQLVLAEAFEPDRGIFIQNEESKMYYIRPNIVQPRWNMEMLGLLMGLAVYNGVTLPVNFPLIMYKHFLDGAAPVETTHNTESALKWIEDGWPDLHRSFQELLAWENGDVADVMVRQYAFVCDRLGKPEGFDMQRIADIKYVHSTWRQKQLRQLDGIWTTQDEVGLVTNANREEFVKDYVSWLVDHSIGGELPSFIRGFRTCLAQRTMDLLDPAMLKAIVEGDSKIDTRQLQTHTQYGSEYAADTPIIQWFWGLVHDYPEEKKRQLLEFVTASDRVPVRGYASMEFWIEKRGPDSELLPISSTCFGRLLLPEYEGKEKLAGKLGVALEHSRGFGSV